MTRPQKISGLAEAMQRWGYLESPAPEAALRWIDTFLDAYGDRLETLEDARPFVHALRELEVTIPALELERLRNRQVLFFLDAVGQYVREQPELRGLPLERDIPTIAEEFGIGAGDAAHAVRVALSGEAEGVALGLLFPLLGHDRIQARLGAVSGAILHGGRGLEPLKFGPGGVPFRTIEGVRPGNQTPGESS
ncbi:MAG: hypothetical protein JO359_13635 [Candidatus Eremiobacteraeota bacterium]|nr:hypothetical protein [Candidatus Eremiobacteraeota bacterium]